MWMIGRDDSILRGGCVTDRELTVLPAKLIKTNDVYISFPVQCRRGSVFIAKLAIFDIVYNDDFGSIFRPQVFVPKAEEFYLQKTHITIF